MEENLEIRKARKEDIPRLKQIFATARQFMASNGNPDQWAPSYPSDEQLLNDINNGDSFVVISDSRQIVATFVLHAGIDPTYNTIYEGQWLNDAPYATIHRIASNGEVKGIFRLALQFALNRYDNIRIDTHHDNIVMRNAIMQNGFSYCGIIHCWNGDERMAYQYVKEPDV